MNVVEPPLRAITLLAVWKPGDTDVSCEGLTCLLFICANRYLGGETRLQETYLVVTTLENFVVGFVNLRLAKYYAHFCELRKFFTMIARCPR